ncbi:Calcium/calmodulin-dependent 3',5'-cyclic nucleotide phosphodiesterase 1C [Halocaridina rubra]|uniref:Calcium/calmodulin-dependent 3',5'-cyclic nucleotide phosphodiesterase 1C n=1 Tax=Halocaridina rubra TaxID=373956 RepID=A0AAN8XH43_HALRR
MLNVSFTPGDCKPGPQHGNYELNLLVSKLSFSKNSSQNIEQGSLTILRRSSSRSLSGRGSRHSSYADDDTLDSVDLAQDALPAPDNPEACEKAALRLRGLLRALQKGEVDASVLQENLQYAAEVLESTFIDDTRSRVQLLLSHDLIFIYTFEPFNKNGD